MLPYSDLDKPTVLTALKKIGHTPKISHQDNIVKTTAKMKINSDGTISGEATIQFQGLIEVSYRAAQNSNLGRTMKKLCLKV